MRTLRLTRIGNAPRLPRSGALAHRVGVDAKGVTDVAEGEYPRAIVVEDPMLGFTTQTPRLRGPGAQVLAVAIHRVGKNGDQQAPFRRERAAGVVRERGLVEDIRFEQA